MRKLLLSLCVCLASTAARADVPADLGARVTDAYIRPATQQFANSAAALSGAIEFLCREPDQARLDTVRQRFDNTVDSWFRIFFLRFGPLVEDNRFDRIFLWPDPRGVMLRQVQEVLASNDPAAIDAEKLAGKSVAVRGLPALEYTLFGDGAAGLLDSSTEGRYRCAYALAVADGIANTAAAIAEAWGPSGDYARDFTNPGPANAVYRDEAEVAAETVKALAGGPTFLSTAVIGPFLGKEPEQTNAKLAPFWRSGSTLRAIRRGVEGLRDFYAATDFANSLSAADRWIDGSLRLEMRRIIETLEKIDGPVDQVVTPGAGREALVYTVIALKSLHTTIDTRLAKAVGVTTGFNALDGD